MTSTPFVNLDAQFLDTLGETFLSDGDIETGLRLRICAQRLEALDEAARNRATTDDYTRGRRDAFAEIYMRSNLPPEERTLPKAMQAYDLGSVTIKKIPRGVSGLGEPKFNAMPRHLKTAGAVAKITGITLNLAGLKGKQE